MRRALGSLVLILLAIAISIATLWAGLALWFRLPVSDVVKSLFAGLFGFLGIATVIALFGRHRLAALLVYGALFASVLVWWNTIRPPAYANWSPDVSRQMTGTVEGEVLTLVGVRDFEWRSETDFTETWLTRSYDLAKLHTLDLFMSYWAGPQKAHVILSFGFDNGDFLALSVEVRRRVGGAFSPIADLFKTNPLVIIAADERDVVGVRSNVRGEDVQLFRLNVSPAITRALLLEFVSDANRLSQKPRFFNSLTTNCTTTIWRMVRAVGDVAPFDWRLIVNGFLPDYLYSRGALASGYSVESLREAGRIVKRAQAAGLSSPNFSQAIRVGVPSPPRDTP